MCIDKKTAPAEMKLLYLPNETSPGDQVGPRAAFNTLIGQGRLAGLEIFSFRVEARKFGSTDHLWEKLLEKAETFEPDIVLFQHIGRFPIARSIIIRIKSIRSRPTVAYQEGDVFGRLFKPFTRSMKAIVKESDIVFLVGLGENAKRFLKYGAKHIRYSPSCVDTIRFGSNWNPTTEREFDIVMIANRAASRFPLLNFVRWGRMPGSFERERLVRRLGEVFGERFAIFGHGWDSFIGNRGPIPFNDQEKTMRKAWLTIGWNHFHTIPYFFPNRLPISLASGIAHLTNYQEGYENLFRNGEHLVWAQSVEGIVDTARVLLSHRPGQLIKLGLRGRAFALKNLTSQVVYESILERIATFRQNKGHVAHFLLKKAEG